MKCVFPFADISVATFAIPMEISSHFSENSMSTTTCQIVEYLIHTSLCANIYCVVAITIDRYRSVMYPLLHRLSTKAPFIIIGFFWAISFAYAGRVIPLYSVVTEQHMGHSGWELFILCRLTNTESNHNYVYVLVDFFITYVVPLAAISIMYIRVIRKSHQSEPANWSY